MGIDSTWIETILLVLFVCLIIVFLWVMIWDSNRFVIRKYVFQSDRLKKNCRIVFLTDLHNKEYGIGNEKLLQAIGELAPDLILIGGDMLQAKPGVSFEKGAQFVLKCAEKYPVCYAFGNHEYRAGIYPEIYGTMYQDYMKCFEESNVRFLNNESVSLQESGIRITGLNLDRRLFRSCLPTTRNIFRTMRAGSRILSSRDMCMEAWPEFPAIRVSYRLHCDLSRITMAVCLRSTAAAWSSAEVWACIRSLCGSLIRGRLW